MYPAHNEASVTDASGGPDICNRPDIRNVMESKRRWRDDENNGTFVTIRGCVLSRTDIM